MVRTQCRYHPTLNALVAVSKVMQAVKVCTNKVVQY